MIAGRAIVHCVSSQVYAACPGDEPVLISVYAKGYFVDGSIC